MSKGCSWDAHITRVLEVGKAPVSKMDAILTDSHLDTNNRIKTCILINNVIYQSWNVDKHGRGTRCS